ncbi:hypothetical protein SSX86_022722 [Deinandra increscens subsp. villosa]|uniref:Transferase, Chloramphenicol acetyltransferase-like domain protein n=1 Tax=Deinandra increscens subsp. villosa TaxID=3103831 RepID=A0AAP0GPB6_9ASTR
MNVEKQPSNLIKPCIPTPPTLRHYKMSFIDELAPSMNVSAVLFFSVNHDHGPNFTTRLEQSLEKTLTRFYPLAGRYVDETHTIDCNDEGVEFTHAKVNIKMQDNILDTQENVKFVEHFLPSEIRDADPLLAVQATVFECGGVTLGVRAAHKIVDASTLCTFINEWAATNQEEINGHEFTGPGFMINSSSLFPGRSFSPIPLQPISDDDMSSKYIRKVFKFSETCNIENKIEGNYGWKY